jgi:hypothetical protein
MSVAAATALIPCAVASAGEAPLHAKSRTTSGAAVWERRTARPSAEITVVARLVDVGRRAPWCGIIKAVGVHRYEVLRVVSGHFDERDLYVAIMCPEGLFTWGVGGAGPGGPKVAYAPGVVVQLSLVRGLPDGALFDAFRSQSSARYRLGDAAAVRLPDDAHPGGP